MPSQIDNAPLLITNYLAYRKATALPCWALYQVRCFRRGCYYLGISSQLERRVFNHLAGYVGWTKDRGVHSVRVLALFSTREDAEIAEWRYFQKRRKGREVRIGGFSIEAQMMGLGLA